jgi:uncharacterized protein YbjT (DUF2867 family)
MRVAVTGGTGFVGTAVVNELLRRGHGVRVVVRDPEKARSRFNHPVETASGDILDPASLGRALGGCQAIVHLVGIIVENRRQSFDAVHRQGTENVLAAAARAGAGRLIHMSAMGSSLTSPSEYGRTKAMGEEAVKKSSLDWTVFRPSVIFGPGDGFVTLLARIVRSSPLMIPVIGRGETKFMPVSVRDVARLFADALEKPAASRRSFEVGGSAVLTMNEIVREIAAALGRPRKPLVHLPVWYGRILATAMRVLPHPPLTHDQLSSLSVDNVGDTGPTLEIFGGTYLDFKPGIREYLRPRSRHDPMVGI